MCLMLHYSLYLLSILWFFLPKKENNLHFLWCIFFISMYMPFPQQNLLPFSPFISNTESENKILVAFYCHNPQLIICSVGSKDRPLFSQGESQWNNVSWFYFAFSLSIRERQKGILQYLIVNFIAFKSMK